jgi:hypothetical protein
MPNVLSGFLPRTSLIIATYYKDLGELSTLPGNETMVPKMLYEAISASGTHSELQLAIAWSALDLPGDHPRSNKPSPTIEDYLHGRID